MAKQIKLGFDKIPGPFTNTYERLYDINTGVPLLDGDGNPLYTDVYSGVKEYGTTKTSTSAHINNQPLSGGPVPVIEQFPETSQVSSSLLGVPRAEVQLSLFADVSVYGLDENIWEFFSYIGGPGFQPYEWYTRRNKIFGNRYFQRLEEIENEAALAITAYPIPWTYPFGPNFKDVYNLHDETLFKEYIGFITLGNFFYDYYTSRNRENFAKNNFLSKSYAGISGDGKDVTYHTETYTKEEIFAEIEKWTITWMRLRDGELTDEVGEKITFPSSLVLPPGYDATNTSPGYFSTGREYYGHLETKRTFRYQPGRISGFTFGLRASTDPGSVDNIIEWGCGNESDEYVFQLKGKQFNIVRRSVIPLPVSNLLHMGLKETDQRVAPVLNPLRTAAYKEESGDYSGSDVIYETVISRDKFNGDPLNGNGPSGFIVKFENVTMWKIEFSWYGAIGAKFYIYVPTGNNGARWVLIHTLIIENELNKPCLKDPFFKFKYMMAMKDTSNLREPQYIYKYGASYYIDGGDDGSVTNHNYSSNNVRITSNNTRSIVGISPKDIIYNSDGEGNRNRKDVIPQRMTVTSEVNAQIDVIDCDACPGFAHHYTPSLRNGIQGIVGNFFISKDGSTLLPQELTGTINSSGSIVTISGLSSTAGLYQGMPVNKIAGSGSFGEAAKIASVDSATQITITSSTNNTAGGITFITVPTNWKPEVGYKKIIADGLYSSYINPEGKIYRRSAESIRNNEITNTNYATTSKVLKSNGTLFPLTASDGSQSVFTNVRLSGYDTLVASPVALSKSRIRVNFLNPVSYDGQHFAEFFVGITKKKPSLKNEIVNNESVNTLVFDNQPLDLESDVVFVEYSQYAQNKDINGYDSGEIDPRWGLALEIDPRLGTPPGYDSGRCSQVRLDINEESFAARYAARAALPIDDTILGQHFLTFTTNDLDAVAGVKGGEIGILDANERFYGSGVYFDDTSLHQYTENQTIKWCIAIAPAAGSTIDVSTLFRNVTEISLKTLTLAGRWVFKSKVFNYDIFPLYVVFGLRDNAQVNNITFEEFDEVGKFSYSPSWLKDSTSTATVINSGKPPKVVYNLTGTINSNASIAKVTGLASTSALKAGMTLSKVDGLGSLGSFAQIQSIDTDTEITISANSVNTAGSIIFNATDINAEGFNPTTGLFEAGGSSFMDYPPTNFVDNYRLDAGQVDTQLQQPLRPGEIRSSFYIGENKTEEYTLTHVFGPDRYTLTPGIRNSKATFVTAKALGNNVSGDIKINLLTKEQ